MNTSDILNKAADLIEQRGWARGSGWEHEKGGPLCLEGGILAAIGGSFLAGDHYRCPAYKAVRSYLADRTTRSPFLWNDSLSFDHVSAEIDKGRFGDVPALWAEADELAAAQVVGVLRACAVIESAREREPAEAS